MNTCWYGTVSKDYERIIKHWNSKPLIKKNIGEIGGSKPLDLDAHKYLSNVSEHLFKIPFSTDFKFDKGMVNRMHREIDKIEKNYKNKKISLFKRYYYVPDAVANYSPVTRVFFENVNSAINYERNNMEQYITYTKNVAKHMRTALMDETGWSKSKVKAKQKEFSELEAKILVGEGGPSAEGKYLSEYNKVFGLSGQAVIEQYINLMETPKNEYLKIRRTVKNQNIVKAVDESRELLNRMGDVMISGLTRMENVVKLAWDSPILTRTGKNYVDKIKAAKDKIKEGMEQGNYFPHYLLSNLVETNYKLSAITEAKTQVELDHASKALTEVWKNIETLIPDKAKARNEMIQNIWSKNPFFVLTQYSKDAIAFNKINFIQEAYIPAMKRFQKEDINPQFIQSMRNFLDDTFQISTKGLMERPNWVNATVRSLMAVETLKSMGLSVTGAIRNGASALYFFQENGIVSASKAINQYNHKYTGRLAAIEEKQGFKFKEAGRELVAEGLIPSSVNVTDIVYDPVKNSVKYRDKGVLKTLDPAIDWSVGKALTFHRWTENATRKWMFRVAWVQAYEKLQQHQAVSIDKYKNPETAALENDAKIEKMATRFALQTVNKFAFEYAPHAKARAIGGTAPRAVLGENGLPVMKARDYATAVGEVTFQFLHYPMSFLNLQSKIAVGAKDALLSGQTNAPEIKQAMRFAGIYMGVGALSTLFNLDFTNTLENDTVERLNDIRDYLTLDEEELEQKGKRGLINDFTGPVVGDIFYALNMFQLLDMPDENWQKMLTGYVDYYAEGQVPDWVGPNKKIDTEEKRKMWNKLNVEFSRWRTGIIPAFRDSRGMDIPRIELGWYPRPHLKERRKLINKYSKKYTGYKPFTTNKKNQKQAELNLIKLAQELRDL